MTVPRTWDATPQRREAARVEVAKALDALRDDDPARAGSLLVHVAHGGVWVADILAEIIDQTGGTL